MLRRVNIDTFRYLLSALVQVFGAVVAVDAMFLIFQNQSLANRRSQVLRRLGRDCELIERSKRIPVLSGTDTVRAGVDTAALMFECLSRDEIEESLSKAEKTVEDWNTARRTMIEQARAEGQERPSLQTELDQSKKTLPVFRRNIEEYHRIESNLKDIPWYVALTMGVPAAASVVFAVLLSLTELGPGWRMSFAIIALVLSAVVFAFLTLTARKIVQDT